MIVNQLARRNVNDYQRAMLAIQKRDVIARQAKANQATSTDGAAPQLSENSPKAAPIDTREEVAKLAGVSSNTIAKIAKIEQQAVPAVKASLLGGLQLSVMTLLARYH